MNDSDACSQGGQCRRAHQGSESAAIVQRLEELMRRCREDGHRIVYQDLLEVRSGAEQPQRGGAA